MPEVTISSPLDYIGMIFILFGLYLILGGIGIVRIPSIIVLVDRKTWVVGVGMVLVGIILLLPGVLDEPSQISASNSPLTSTSTSTPTLVSTSTPTSRSTNTSVATPQPRQIESQFTGIDIRVSYRVTLENGEAIVGRGNKFEGTTYCVAFLIVGPRDIEFSVESGIWYKWAHTNPQRNEDLLQEQVEIQAEKYCEPVKTVRIP